MYIIVPVPGAASDLRVTGQEQDKDLNDEMQNVWAKLIIRSKLLMECMLAQG